MWDFVFISLIFFFAFCTYSSPPPLPEAPSHGDSHRTVCGGLVRMGGGHYFEMGRCTEQSNARLGMARC